MKTAKAKTSETSTGTETPILETKRTDVYKIDPRNIDVEDGFNGRTHFPQEEHEALKASIKANGVQTPILVRKKSGTDRYVLRNGERRLRACMELVSEGIEIRIPATIFTGSELDAVISMLITNDNVELSLVEEAGILYRLQQMGLTPKEISTRTGRKLATVSTLLKLNEAPVRIKNLISEKVITATLVMQILREEKDFDNALAVIECAIEGANKGTGVAEEPKKITSKDINKSKGKANSFSALKKAFSVSNKKELTPRMDKVELYEFAKKIYEGKYSLETLMSELFEPEVSKK